eukprot:CAMPEP_0114257860 /NCGR_PEP_ID=MMETSP0058-20121206/18973_1 /TAXON_ID=36894 /ORGANISM="Pyramimonas parkeae, CCMP726" /LENGTH=169 /DNA_ID=CAMNT_0001372645 /DNA_START=33 /DNA_END=542 /DNA_ORIENTATION=-
MSTPSTRLAVYASYRARRTTNRCTLIVNRQRNQREMKNAISADISKLRLEDDIGDSSALQRAILATVCVPVAVFLMLYFLLRILSVELIGNHTETSIPWMSISWGVFVILERISRIFISSRSEAAQREGSVGDNSTYEEEEQRIWIEGVERYGKSYASSDLLDALIKDS